MVFPQVSDRRDDAERLELANIRKLFKVNDFLIMNVTQEYCYLLPSKPLSCIWFFFLTRASN